MSLGTFFIIVVGVLLNAVAQLSLKSGANSFAALNSETFAQKLIGLSTLWQVYLGLSLYAFSVAIWFVALMRAPVSVAYPMLSIGYVVNLVLAYYLFNEPITYMKTAGIFLILVGVYILARS